MLMSRHKLTGTRILSLLAVIVLLPLSANAAVITFGNTQIIPLVGIQMEGPFTYQVVSGNLWGLQTNFGNPPAVLSTGPVSAPTIGDTVEFFLTGGGLFNFASFDFGGFASIQSDTVDFIGEVNGLSTASLLGISATSSTFQTLAGFGGAIDKLKIVISGVGVTDLGLDNLVLNQVPEPATLLLIGLGLTGLSRGRRRRGV